MVSPYINGAPTNESAHVDMPVSADLHKAPDRGAVINSMPVPSGRLGLPKITFAAQPVKAS